jgi:hypothetical protein
MSEHFTSRAGGAADGALQHTFLKLLPTIESVARPRFRRIPCTTHSSLLVSTTQLLHGECE